MSRSYVTALYERRELHKRSAFAVARAKRQAALMLPVGKLRSFIASKAKRQEACAAMQYNRIITPREGPSFRCQFELEGVSPA